MPSPNEFLVSGSDQSRIELSESPSTRSDVRHLLSITTTLKDHTPVLIRPVQPEDKPLREIDFAHLSDRSHYFRFLRPIARLSDWELDYLTSMHGPDHVAFGAMDITAEPLPVGIGRYVRLPAEPKAAEIAVTVIDSHQKRGLGSLLIGALAASAVMNVMSAFVALVHASNTPMPRLFRELDATVRTIDAAEKELRIPLHTDPACYPRTRVGDVMRCAHTLSMKAEET